MNTTPKQTPRRTRRKPKEPKMSNSAARFSFAPSVRNVRGADLDTDREIRLFQDTNYYQCRECGRYERHDKILASDRCEECVEADNGPRHLIVKKNFRRHDFGETLAARLIDG